ncbi:MAG: MarR family winged helix-turn-helix transcriptional regulator [Cypionkella sp.]
MDFRQIRTMSVSKHHPLPTPRALATAGLAPEVVDALLSLDASMFQWMRAVMRGEMPSHILAELNSDLDFAQFQALTAVTRLQFGIGRPAPTEATIGLLAEEMHIDPSRASRIATDLTERGMLRREVSQSDGRRAVLVLTDQARQVLVEFRELKWAKQLAFLHAWPEEDILRLSQLFIRYTLEMQSTLRPND